MPASLTAPIQLRYGTAASATSNNPVLKAGEKGIESDTGRTKTGDGTTAWNSLPYDPVIVVDWAANTPYKAGHLVVQGGALQRRKTAGTSGTTFDQTQWDNLGASAATTPQYGARPADHGLNGWSYDSALTPAGSAIAAGLLYLAKIRVPETKTMSNLHVVVSGAGSGLSGVYGALYGSDGTRIAVSPDTPAFLQSTGSRSVAFTSPVQVTGGDSTFVWAALLVGAGTMPSLARQLSFVGAVNNNLSAANARGATNGTGQTATPATITPGNNTLINALYYMALS